MDMSKFAGPAEIIGIFLILASGGSQVFLAEPVQEIETGASFYEVNERLVVLFQYVDAIGREGLRPANTPSQTLVSNAFRARWREIDSLETPVKKQARGFRRIAGLLFLLGSFLVAMGRGYEIRLRTKHRT